MRAKFVTAVALALLAVSSAGAFAADEHPTVTVKDGPGAPREMLLQMEKLVERSAAARQKLEAMQASTKKRMAARQAPPLPEIQRPD